MSVYLNKLDNGFRTIDLIVQPLPADAPERECTTCHDETAAYSATCIRPMPVSGVWGRWCVGCFEERLTHSNADSNQWYEVSAHGCTPVNS